MNRLIIVLLAFGALLNVSCEKDYDGTIYIYDDAFVLECGELVPAHRYVVDFPAAGGTVDLAIVSSGIHYNGPKSPSDRFDVELLDKIDEDPESKIFDYVEKKVMNWKTERVPRYLQTLRISARPNKQLVPKITKLVISTSGGLEGARASVSLRQAGVE